MNFNPMLIPAVLIAITFHEYAHGYTALYFGDPTAKNAGRLTLNPISHIDIIGTLMLLLAGFGWAKPVPVNPYLLKNPKKDLLYISLAGPLMNLALAFFFSIIGKAIPLLWDHLYIKLFITYTIHINIILAWFNLIPIPPLDGYKILAGLLPDNKSAFLYQLEKVGPIVFIGLILVSYITGFSIIRLFLDPFVNITYSIMP